MEAGFASKLVKRALLLVVLLLLGTVTYIAEREVRKPSPHYWWRKAAESSLTRISIAAGNHPVALPLAEDAWTVRDSSDGENYASSPTARRLAEASEENDNLPLSAITRIYLALDEESADESARLQLTKEAFEMHPGELTAWQYASRLAGVGEPVPSEVVLAIQRSQWEYAAIIEIDTRAEAVSASVAARQGRINDSKLFQLAEAAVESEREFRYLSRPDVQNWALAELRNARATVLSIAEKNRFWDCLFEGVGVFLDLTIRGFANLFIDPGPVEFGTVASKTFRRCMSGLDALAGIGAVATCNDRILKAREAVAALDRDIYALESGERLASVELEMASKRSALISRINVLRADPRRYPVRSHLVSSTIRGEDANVLFLEQSVTSGFTF